MINASFSENHISDDNCKVCVIVPAYNEASRIAGVLGILAQVSVVDEITVVDDGSLDGTSDAVRAHPIAAQSKLRLIRQEPNRGKGAAMLAGAEATTCPVIVFLDADLINLTPQHVEDLIRPVTTQGKAMALGVFRGGRGWTTLAQILAPNISGQRAILRDVFLSVPRLIESKYGVELAITNHVLGSGLPIARVVLKDVTHPMKEEKLGMWRGFAARIRMYWQMTPHVLQRTARRLRGKP